MSDEKERSLRELGGRLILTLAGVSMRGTGAARFLYVIGNGKSAEVSWNGDQVWVQFWESPDEDAAPTNEALFASIDDAEAAIRHRLV